MTTITNIAQRILDENNYTVGDISLVNMEYLIGNAVDYINMQAGTTITFIPSGGTQSLTASDPQIFAIKTLSALMIRAYKEKGPQVGVSGLSVAQIIADPHYSLFTKFLDKAIERLKSPPIYVTNEPIE